MTVQQIEDAAARLIMEARPYADNPTERTRNAFYIVGICALMDALKKDAGREQDNGKDLETLAADHQAGNGETGRDHLHDLNAHGPELDHGEQLADETEHQSGPGEAGADAGYIGSGNVPAQEEGRRALQRAGITVI